ncbi:hypothetical protein [Vibrio diabolicus]|nr:hypothetical protein [Vibrio diabolicus]
MRNSWREGQATTALHLIATSGALPWIGNAMAAGWQLQPWL